MSRYSNSKSNRSTNKYKVTQSDIDTDNINAISITTSTNNDNNDTSYSILPDIVTYTMLKHTDLVDIKLDDDMIDFLSSMNDIKRNKVDYITVALWREQNKLFDACITEFINLSVDAQEIEMILDAKKSDNIKMFTMKKWKPEYRDNVLPSNTIGTVINVQLISTDKDQENMAKIVTDVTDTMQGIADEHNTDDI